MLVLVLGIAASAAQTCLHTGRAVDAEIIAPMVRAVDAETHETYVWFQGNELNGGKHLNAKCPTCTGGATFQFDIKKAGKYTFQADLIAPNNRDDSLYVTTSVDHGTPYKWSIGVFTSWTNRDIEGIKDKYFPAGTHSITLKPREDGTKVRALKVTTGSENVCFKKAQAPKPKCNTELAADAEIIAPMVVRDGYVWLQGNELNGGKHFNAKCPTCKGGVKFQFNIQKAGKYTFQADLIAPNNRDDSFYVATSVDTDIPYKWDVGKSMGISTVWTWGDIEGVKDKYFPAGTHSITLKPREDGTKVRALRVTTGSENVCFKKTQCASKRLSVQAREMCGVPHTGSVNAPSCALKAGENTCSTTVTWTSSSPSACIYLEPTGQLFACKGLGTHSAVAPWISARPLDFVLHERRSPDSLKLGSAVGVFATNTGSVNAQPCTLKAGENTCSTTVTWTSTSPSACIYLQPSGKLFGCGQSGSQVVPWISARPLDFVLHESKSPESLKLGSAVGVFALQAPAPTESVDVEMVIDETMESFTEDKKESLRDEIASELGLSADKVEITVGTKPNPRSSRRLITGGLLITVTIKIESSTLAEQVDTLASPIFAKKVAAATGIQTAFKAFKPKAGSKICATCKWDGTKVHVVHYTNAQKAGEKGLQHRCYHTRGGKCKCECMSK